MAVETARNTQGIRRTLRLMSCDASLVAHSDRIDEAALESLLDDATARFESLEQRWSRFIATSEVSTLNRYAGHAVRVSTDTVRLVEAMVSGWHATAGSFDPTLLGTLVELGYAHSRSDASLRTSLPATTARRGDPSAIGVDPIAQLVRLPIGTAIDPGGIGKGLAADIVVTELLAAGAAGALVEIGGDIRVGGVAPDPTTGWVIELDTATRPTSTIRIEQGAIATSTSRLRTWETTGGRRRHHLVDPTTLDCSATDSVSCTVIAGTAAWAEVFTKVAFSHDPTSAIRVLEQRRLAASITTADGARLTTNAWRYFEQ